MKHIGNRLRELRLKNDMSQEYVARMLGVSVQAVSKWENGKTGPDIANLVPISSLFHVPVDDLLDKENRYREWENDWQDILASDDIAKRLAFLKDAVAAFPGDYTFRYRLACEEFFAAGEEADEGKRDALLLMSDDHFSSLRKEYPESALAVDMHVRVLSTLGRKEEAIELAKASQNQDRLLMLILEGKELTEHRRKLVTKSLLNLFGDLMREGSHKALTMAETLVSAACAEDGQFLSLLLEAHVQHARLYCEEGDCGAAQAQLEACRALIRSAGDAGSENSGGETPLYCPMMPPASKADMEEKLRQYLREECFAGFAEDRG